MANPLPAVGKHLPSRHDMTRHSKLTAIENDRGRSGRGRTRPPRSFYPDKAMDTYSPRGNETVGQCQTTDLLGRDTQPSRIGANRPTADRARSTHSEIRARMLIPCSGRLSGDARFRISGSAVGAAARISVSRDPARTGRGVSV